MGHGFTTPNPYYPIYQFLNMSLEKNSQDVWATWLPWGQNQY
jgi:hypothetical protein